MCFVYIYIYMLIRFLRCVCLLPNPIYRALFQRCIKIASFNVWVRYLVWNFTCILFACENLRALRFKSWFRSVLETPLMFYEILRNQDSVLWPAMDISNYQMISCIIVILWEVSEYGKLNQINRLSQ